MKGPMTCPNCKGDLHPAYVRDGYCLDCTNAGVPELREEIDRLRAELHTEIGTRHATAERLVLARQEIDRLRAELDRAAETGT